MGKPIPPAGSQERLLGACAAIALAGCAVLGAHAGAGRDDHRLQMLSTLVSVSALTLHCLLDARGRGTRLPSSALWLFVLFWPVALPGYWIATRGWRGVWIAARFAMAAVAVMAVAAWATLALSGARVPLGRSRARLEAELEFQEAFARGMGMDQARAKAIEAELAASPRDLRLRAMLLSYYAMQAGDAAGRSGAEHALWVIRHHPGSGIAGSVYCTIDRRRASALYAEAAELWTQHVRQDPSNLMLLENAARFFTVTHAARAIELYGRAQALDPANPVWPERIARVHALGLKHKTGTERREAARRAYAELKQAIAKSGARRSARLLGDAAKMAFEAEDLRMAAAHASDLLADAARDGDAQHTGYQVLGRLASRAGDVKGAGSHLLKSAEIPRSPILSIIGPRMDLAHDLLEKGERAPVLQFLARCTWWDGGSETLQRWKAEIEAGRIPDLGQNREY